MDALTDIGRYEQDLAAAQGRAQTRAAANVLEKARHTYSECRRHRQAAEAKLRCSFAATRTANRELAALYAPHARGRATGGQRRSAVEASVLDELAAMPLEMVQAADALIVQSSAGKDSLVMLHRRATWAAQAAARTKSSSSIATWATPPSCPACASSPSARQSGTGCASSPSTPKAACSAWSRSGACSPTPPAGSVPRR
ncbi:hypothetical protein [Streptomyces himalayensis]|uniref:hypothetical protein n=1 Tax=Streptomyces himalayensis TaxID=2820085 RepID=UPI001FE6EE01|nr:hypothetical protein [Streptomyces himalayensis]